MQREPLTDHISVCICTYRRNRMLERLLRGLAAQETNGLFDLSVVVVDNDATGGARETVETFAQGSPLELTYDIETERTIPAARNHALRLARGNYIGIIDDDEFPPQHWLATMYRAIQTFDVDGALGPVHPYFEQSPPAWLIKSKFCERPVHRTGTLLHWGQTRTGNVLLKRNVFDKHRLQFDMRMTTGGTDRQFFKEAMQAGCRFVAVEEAPVYEIVPPERWTKAYYIKRSLVNGFNSYTNSRDEMKGLALMSQSAKSAVAVLMYTFVLPFALFRGSHRVVNCIEKGAHHLSRLCAIAGIELIKQRNF